MSVLNIVSLNTNGLGDKEKRRAIYNFYRQKCDILCLQETHSEKESEEIWTNEWGGKSIFSHGTTSARGSAMLFRKGFKGVVCAKILIGELIVCVASVYGPNKDIPEFYTRTFMQSFQMCEKTIIVGDLNVILDPSMDKKMDNNTAPHPKSKSAGEIETLMSDLQLRDIWQDRNPETKRYSWYRILRDKPIQASRLDYCIIAAGLAGMVHNCFYLNGIRSDHSALFVGIETDDTTRGPSYWKMNTQSLVNPEFVHAMNTKLQEFIEENKQVEPIDRWEMLKKEVKQFCIKHGKKQASEDSIAISQLNEYIIEKEDHIAELNENDLNLLETSKEELETLLFKKTRAVMFRMKSRWAMESEKPTKYFYNLEKAKYNAKTCTAVFNSTGDVVKKPENILQIQKEYYQELYTADKTVKCNLTAENVQNKVDEDDIGKSDDPFSCEEFGQAIKNLKNGSCPGSDGIPAEFYKVFWKGIKQSFCEYAKEVVQQDKLCPSSSVGILNLLPKGDKDTRYLKNLRPITLLNTDYKIFEKAISNRMVPALSAIIHEDQTGFLPDRRICTNIRKILDVISESKSKEEANIVVTCDYLKCFDRVEHDCIHKSLEILGFSKILSKYIKILYTGFKLKVQNNGYFSAKINVTRGIRQGGPASNAIFLAIAELLAVALRNDERIEGVYVKEILRFLNQYADDMDMCMKFNEKSLNSALEQIKLFHRSTGFLLSYEKTTIYRIGSLCDSKAELYTPRKMNWSSETVNILGIEITNTDDADNLCKINYEHLIKKSENICKAWEHRNLSLFGKIEVINTLIGSLFVYKMSALPKIPQPYIDTLNGIFERYLWAGHKPKIPLKILQSRKEHGGANLVHLGRKDDALKCSWIPMIFKGQYPAEIVHRTIHEDLQQDIWCCNLKREDVKILRIKNVFWENVLEAWCQYHYTPNMANNPVIWLNSDFRIAGKPFYWPKVHKQGVLRVSDIMEGSVMMSVEEMKMRYQMTEMQCNTLMSVIPAWVKQNQDVRQAVARDVKFYKIMDTEKASQLVYRELSAIQSGVTDRQEKWCEELLEEINLCYYTEHIKWCSEMVKYRSFQYRILMRAIVTNIQLERWKIKDSQECTFGCKTPETYRHIFYECPHIQPLL